MYCGDVKDLIKKYGLIDYRAPADEEVQFSWETDYFYLASPYSKFRDGPTEAFVQAAAATGQLLELGVKVFSPIAHSHPVEQWADLKHPQFATHEFWLRADWPLLHHARGLIVLTMPGWEDSYGVQAEIRYANDREMDIYFVNPLELEHERDRRRGGRVD